MAELMDEITDPVVRLLLTTRAQTSIADCAPKRKDGDLSDEEVMEIAAVTLGTTNAAAWRDIPARIASLAQCPVGSWVYQQRLRVWEARKIMQAERREQRHALRAAVGKGPP